MKATFSVSTLLFSTTLLYLAAAFAADVPAGPVTVTNYGKKGKVTFKHSSHAEGIRCEDCHHNADAEKKCGTAKCHRAKPTGKAPSMKDAAHQKEKGKCWACHFKQSPKATAPYKCKQCHAAKK
jgi:hypothetical protein